jgi:hypothetical protein
MAKAAPAFESFKFMHKPNFEHDPKSVLDNRYSTIESLNGKFVVYSAGAGYRVYKSHHDYLEHFGMMTIAERVFHEVIFDVEQKLKFDIDAPVEKLISFEIPTDEEIDTPDPVEQPIDDDEIDDPEIAALIASIGESIAADEPDIIDSNVMKYRHIFDVILTAIKNAFFVSYGRDIPEECLVICESSDPGKETVKFSNHVIIDKHKVSGFVQSKELTRRIIGFLPQRYRQFLDIAVNKRIQNFRLVGCHKAEDMRIKSITSGQELSSSIITYLDGCTLLPDIAVREIAKGFRSDMNPDDVANVLTVCKQNGIDRDHSYKFNRNGMFIFSRIHGSYCDFCSRMHDSDNTLVVTTSNTNGIITVYKQCRKYIDEHGKDGSHSAVIGEFPSNMAPAEVTAEPDQRILEKKVGSWADKAIERSIKGKDLYAQKLQFDDLLATQKNVYEEPTLGELELSHTLIVHAMMKMGKTKALREYINKHFPDGLRKQVIRFVSFRQTFSGNIKEKFPDFTLYSDVKGPLDQPKLIVQVESLHRLDIQPGDEDPDLLILDECESIFEQFHAGLTNNFECFSKFHYLLAQSKYVICMDANVGDRTFRILQAMRPGFASPSNGIVYHCNRYKNARDDRYYITGDKLNWLGILYSSLEADERIAVPMSSLTEAKILVKNLIQKYPSKNIKLYSSETTMSEKREHFSDVNKHWSQYDVLVYTPTVSAGVSFELKHFDKVFGYFTDQSCPIETCIQMIGRIRDVRDHKFYICLSATGNNLPTSIEAIREWVLEKRDNLFKTYDEIGLTVTYGPNGVRQYKYGDFFQMWLENTRVKNLSKNSFIQRFIEVVTFTGAQVEQLTDQIFAEFTGEVPMIDGELNSDLEAIRDAHAIAKTDIREEVCKKIAEARDLAEGELEDIQSAIIAQQDIPEEQRFAYEKHRLRVTYKYSGVIDEKFVDKYRDTKVRRMFKNISRITGFDNIDEALQQIQAEERATHLYMMELGEKSQHQDLYRKYVYDQHRYTIGLLKLCGWAHINDPQVIHKLILVHNLRNGEKAYGENIRLACREFELRTPAIQTIAANRQNDDRLITLMVKPINKILALMYGVQIISKKSDPDIYFLTANNMFTTDVKKSVAKCIPLIVPVKKTVQLDGFDEGK